MPAVMTTPKRLAQRPQAFTLLELETAIADGESFYIVDGLLKSPALSVLGAPPKSGKSTLTENMIVDVLLGRPTLGRKTTKVPCLYFWSPTEGEAKETVEDFHRLIGNRDDLPLFLWPTEQSDPELAFQELEALIEDHNIKFAVVDMLQDVVKIDDSNSHISVRQGLKPLSQLAQRCGCHIMARRIRQRAPTAGRAHKASLAAWPFAAVPRQTSR